MKKPVKTLLIMLAVLVVLGGAAAALLLLPAETEEASSSVSSATAEIITEIDPAAVENITVENSSGTFTLLPEAGEDETTFTLDGCRQFSLEETALNDAANSVLTLTAAKNLGPQEDLAAFGLTGDEAVKVSVKTTDGTEYALTLGNQAGETTGRYILFDDTVYISAGTDTHLYGSMYAFFSTEIYTVSDIDGNATGNAADSEEDTLYSVQITNPNTDIPIQIRADGSRISGYLMIAPVVGESGTAAFNSLATALKSLTATTVAAVNPTDEDLAAYGLAEPEAQVEFNLNMETHTLKVSAETDGSRYLLYDTVPLIYQVASGNVSTWAEVKASDLRIPYVWMPVMSSVENLSLTAQGDMAYSFDITRTENEDLSTEDNISYDLSVVNVSGDEILSENYTTFYQNLIALSLLNMDEASYEGSPVLSVTYTYFEGGSDTIEYYPISGQDRCAAVVNGVYNGLVRTTDVEKTLSMLEKLNAGELVTE